MLARCVFARGGKGGATTRKTFDCDAKDKRTLNYLLRRKKRTPKRTALRIKGTEEKERSSASSSPFRGGASLFRLEVYHSCKYVR